MDWGGEVGKKGGLMVGMRVCRAWEELGMKGRTISGGVGPFFTSTSLYDISLLSGLWSTQKSKYE